MKASIVPRDDRKVAYYFVSEAAYACQGWFQERRFLVLPELVEGMFNSVILPDIAWLRSMEGRAALGALTKEFTRKDVEDLKVDWQELVGELESWYDDTREKELLEYVPVLQKAVALLWKLFDFGFEEMYLHILPVRFGTATSFFRKQDSTSLEMLITLRQDADTAFLLEGLISNLLGQILGRGGQFDVSKWQWREDLTDFLLHNSRIAELVDLTKHRKTIEALWADDLQKMEYLQGSQRYLESLGFRVSEKLKLDWELAKTKLSDSEWKLARCLYEKRGTVVTYEELAERLYGENWPDKFSLEYLAKVVEGIRKKSRQMGIVRNVVFTQRGQGYGWWD